MRRCYARWRTNGSERDGELDCVGEEGWIVGNRAHEGGMSGRGEEERHSGVGRR